MEGFCAKCGSLIYTATDETHVPGPAEVLKCDECGVENRVRLGKVEVTGDEEPAVKAKAKTKTKPAVKAKAKKVTKAKKLTKPIVKQPEPEPAPAPSPEELPEPEGTASTGEGLAPEPEESTGEE